jgi:hypothetical protein
MAVWRWKHTLFCPTSKLPDLTLTKKDANDVENWKWSTEGHDGNSYSAEYERTKIKSRVSTYDDEAGQNQ